MKRSSPNDSTATNKKPKSLQSSDSAVARAKARLLEKAKKKASATTTSTSTSENGPATPELGHGGLNVDIHPLLRKTVPLASLTSSKNPLKPNIRKWFDPTSINPYLNQSDSFLPNTRPSRPLHFVEKGKYTEKAEEIREKFRAEKEERERLLNNEKNGLTADETLGEHFYKPVYPPSVEWWDRPYLKSGVAKGYDSLDPSNLDYENEDAPVSIYIQHPPFIQAPWEKHLPQQPKQMHLTKKERKRIRRNDRIEKHKDQQDRIKLGLDPPPPPKIKLSNLMNVLTNEAIQDPTAIEMRVREEVEERFQNHMAENEARKLTKEERHLKLQQQHIKDLQKGYFTTVFKIDNLSYNPKNFYKLDINAKQLDLVGICLLNPKFNLVIVEGGSKNINFYKKLLTRRIDWTEYVKPKSEDGEEQSANVQGGDIPDLSGNKCTIIWEGQIKDLTFKKWSIMRTSNEDESIQVLNRFNVENYWRQASNES